MGPRVKLGEMGDVGPKLCTAQAHELRVRMGQGNGTVWSGKGQCA